MRLHHLRRQHRLLRERGARTDALLNAIENGTDRLDDYAREAGERWGKTEAWTESQRRTAAYTKDDWVQIKREADANIGAFAEAIRAGEPPTGQVAMDLAEAHREHTTRWFYDCSHERHRALAELYVSDPRFVEPWEDIAPGFSHYVHDAIVANAERAHADG